jgi:hypothetical protein
MNGTCGLWQLHFGHSVFGWERPSEDEAKTANS